MRVPFTLHHGQSFVLFVSLLMATLTRVRWNLITMLL
jgi:hypothetical protein